jgi:hypothetical protein
MHEICDVCGVRIEREFYFGPSVSEPVAVWLGVCGCPARRWRWRSTTGDGPWELVGGDSPADAFLD